MLLLLLLLLWAGDNEGESESENEERARDEGPKRIVENITHQALAALHQISSKPQSLDKRLKSPRCGSMM